MGRWPAPASAAGSPPPICPFRQRQNHIRTPFCLPFVCNRPVRPLDTKSLLPWRLLPSISLDGPGTAYWVPSVISVPELLLQSRTLCLPPFPGQIRPPGLPLKIRSLPRPRMPLPARGEDIKAIRQNARRFLIFHHKIPPSEHRSVPKPQNYLSHSICPPQSA